MCGLYSLSKSPRETKAWFKYQEDEEFPPRAHVAPGQPIAVVRMEDGAETLDSFTVCGPDRVFVPARARITGRETVVVWADEVPSPVAVAYGFTAMNQSANLVNAAGQPAAPFRTDRVASVFVPVFPDPQFRTETD